MSELHERLNAYRDAFDASFAAPAREEVAARVLLALRAGDRAVAIDAAAVSRVDRVGRIARVAGVGARVGLAAVRGRIVAVWDLAALLGAARPVGEAPWLVVIEPGIALACAAFEGLLHVPEAAIREVGGEEAHVVGVVREARGPRAVIGVGSIRAAICDRAGIEET